jgi:hypothetical protein
MQAPPKKLRKKIFGFSKIGGIGEVFRAIEKLCIIAYCKKKLKKI